MFAITQSNDLQTSTPSKTGSVLKEALIVALCNHVHKVKVSAYLANNATRAQQIVGVTKYCN